jgi:small subunit ribosomal protein S1
MPDQPPEPEPEDFAALLAEYDQGHPNQKKARRPKVGDTVRGKVISIGKDAIFVDLGGKAEGVLDREQVADSEGKVRFAVGDTIEARVVDDRGGALQLKVRMGGRGADSSAELIQAADLGLAVEGTVTEVVKGGLSVDVVGVRGFCPASQVDVRFVDDLTPFVGQRLSFKVTRYEPGPRGNLVLSRRALLEVERAALAGETLGKLVPGLVVRGTVTAIKPYGAFVDIGGIEGMLHVSELGFARVGHPQDVLSIGQEVECAILEVKPSEDPKKPLKVSLSLKALSEDPWRLATESLVEGQTITGTVTRLQPFGAFVEIAPGVEGLVHISELAAGKRINHPKEVLKVGQTVETTILALDAEKRRISLSVAAGERAAEAAELEEARAIAPKAPKTLGTFGDLLNKAKNKK